MSTSKRITITLPEDLVAGLDRSSSVMGITRSALIASILQEVSPPIIKMMDLLPTKSELSASDAEAEVKRFRGASAKIIGEQVMRLLATGEQGDLFNPPK